MGALIYMGFFVHSGPIAKMDPRFSSGPLLPIELKSAAPAKARRFHHIQTKKALVHASLIAS